MKNKKIIIIFIIITSVIGIILGICSMQGDDKENHSGKDTPTDVKVEEFEDELIVVPSTQEKSDENNKKDSKGEIVEPNVNQGTKKEVQEDSEIENEEKQLGLGIDLGENELPFVPAE